MLLPPNKSKINELENSGEYIAEKKWNGDNVLIDTNDINHFWNRNHEYLKYIPNDPMKAELSAWPRNMVINAELIHNHTKIFKNLLIVHCVMIWKGKPFIGKTWNDSRKILNDQLTDSHVQVSVIHQSNFWELFEATDGIVIEGIILKKLSGKLVFSATPISDVPWMLKIRKPCKKYSF
jgi:hypothetical protein